MAMSYVITLTIITVIGFTVKSQVTMENCRFFYAVKPSSVWRAGADFYLINAIYYLSFSYAAVSKTVTSVTVY